MNSSNAGLGLNLQDGDDSDNAHDLQGTDTENTKNLRKDPLYVELCNVFDGLEDGIREAGKNKLEMTVDHSKNM